MNHCCQKWISFSIVAAVAIVGFIAVANCTGDSSQPKNVEIQLILPQLITFDYYGYSAYLLTQKPDQDPASLSSLYRVDFSSQNSFRVNSQINGWSLGVSMPNGGKLVHDGDAALTTHPLTVYLTDGDHFDYWDNAATAPQWQTDWPDGGTADVSQTFVTMDENDRNKQYVYFPKYDINIELLEDASGMYRGTVVWTLTPPLSGG